MDRNNNIRWSWLKFMYVYTIVGAGAFGLGILAIPDVMRTIFGWPNSDQIIAFGVTGSVYFSFALLSMLGLQSPLKFAPLLLLQFTYKVVWFVGIVLPLLLTGKFPTYALVFTAIYMTYIIGDLIAIPFSYVFAKQPAAELELNTNV